jgi:surface antigen
MRRNPITQTMVAVTGLTAAAILGLAAPAQAADRDGTCDTGEFCYYYNSNNGGSISDFADSVSDYGTSQPTCYDFKGPGNGQGQCIKNNAASAWNRSTKTVRVYYNTGYAGQYQDVAPGAKGNLNSTLYNQNASHQFLSGTIVYPSGDDYPYKGQTTGVDKWNFYKGQCTSFAAWAINSRLKISFSNSYKGVHWGNAINWDNAARSAGISVTGTPRAGDIAVRNSGTFGHVAFVTSVKADGTFAVDEYNFTYPSAYSHRTASVGTGSSNFDSFIHFK